MREISKEEQKKIITISIVIGVIFLGLGGIIAFYILSSQAKKDAMAATLAAEQHDENHARADRSVDSRNTLQPANYFSQPNLDFRKLSSPDLYTEPEPTPLGGNSTTKDLISFGSDRYENVGPLHENSLPQRSTTSQAAKPTDEKAEGALTSMPPEIIALICSQGITNTDLSSLACASSTLTVDAIHEAVGRCNNLGINSVDLNISPLKFLNGLERIFKEANIPGSLEETILRWKNNGFKEDEELLYWKLYQAAATLEKSSAEATDLRDFLENLAEKFPKKLMTGDYEIVKWALQNRDTRAVKFFCSRLSPRFSGMFMIPPPASRIALTSSLLSIAIENHDAESCAALIQCSRGSYGLVDALFIDRFHSRSKLKISKWNQEEVNMICQALGNDALSVLFNLPSELQDGALRAANPSRNALVRHWTKYALQKSNPQIDGIRKAPPQEGSEEFAMKLLQFAKERKISFSEDDKVLQSFVNSFQPWTPPTEKQIELLKKLVEFGAKPTEESVIAAVLAKRKENTTHQTLSPNTCAFEQLLKVLVTLPEINLNALDRNHQSALYLACSSGFDDCVALLLDAGANPSVDGKIPINAALQRASAFRSAKDFKILDLLLGHPLIDLNKQDEISGETPLTFVESLGDRSLYQRLIAEGANPNQTNRSGDKPKCPTVASQIVRIGERLFG